MCDTCGCGDTNIVSVDVHERILAKNDRTALHNREHFTERGTLAVNLMGSPGSGKTAVLEATARVIRSRIVGIAGDLATDRDERRLRAAGIHSVTINTGSMCHLDADLVHHALHDFDWRDAAYLFIENIGNLVCPAVYDLGQHVNVVALSVTEGEDKPLKYPVMFQKADLVLITKVDLLSHLPRVSLTSLIDSIERVMPAAAVIPVSAESGFGFDQWSTWLEERRAKVAPAPVEVGKG